LLHQAIQISFDERLVLDSALPNYNYSPSRFFQLTLRLSVSYNIPLNFIFPEFVIGLREGGVLTILVMMPEAAVNEDYGFVFRQNYVGLAR